MMHRLARFAVPDHGSFALIRDSDAGDIGGSQSRLAERFGRGVQLRGPNLRRIVFHPAGLGENLAKLLLRRRNDAAAVVEHHGARAGGALVESQDVLHAGHHVRYTDAAIRPPMIGPATGIHAYPQSEFPLPAIGRSACASRGPKSRAGLIAYPVGPPNDRPMAHTRIPTRNGP